MRGTARLRHLKWIRLLFAACATATAASCAVLNPPINEKTYPPLRGATLIEIPSQHYVQLWYEMQACSGLRGSFSAITWFQAERIIEGKSEYDGMWYSDRNRIVIRTSKLTHDATIKHEMLHALLRRATHPEEHFNGPCGQLHPIPD